VETGGKKGKIARLIVNQAAPYGTGMALGLVTQAQVDLLTIEFRDRNNAYHGVVFILPKGEADGALKQLSPKTPSNVEEQSPIVCSSETFNPMTVKISTIASPEIELPDEYKVALYEQLFGRLRKDAVFKGVYRDGLARNTPSR
jgi:hypothetical protein